MSSKNTQATLSTTAFIVHTDKFDLSILESNYQIYTYQIPDAKEFSKNEEFVLFDINKKSYVYKYDRLQNFFKEQLSCAFYYHSHTRMLYVLNAKGSNSLHIPFPSQNDKSLSAKHISFKQLATEKTDKDYSQLHILMKLLLAEFHLFEEAKMAQFKFFVYAKYKSKQKHHIGLNISIQENWKKNAEDKPQKEYMIMLKPTAFWAYSADKIQKIEDKHILTNHYYEKCEIIQNEAKIPYLYQVKSSHVKSSNQELYVELTPQFRKAWKAQKNEKLPNATLDWYNHSNLMQSRYPIIATFQKNFVQMLNNCGINAEAREIKMTKFSSKATKKDFNVDLLKEIHVYDIRQNKTFDINSYINIIRNHLKQEKIEIIIKGNGEKIDKDTPTIVLYDIDKQAFGEGGLLSKDKKIRLDDEKVALYKKYPNAILHTWIVNDHASEDYTNFDRYLQYELLDSDKDANLKHKINVILKELFLKTYVKQKRNIITPEYILPCFSDKNVMFPLKMESIAYIYKNVLMYVADNQFQFIDMEKEINERNKRLESYNLTQSELNQYFQSKFSIEAEEEDKLDIKEAMFIVSEGLCLEIESLAGHRVMPDLERLLEAIKLRAEEEKQNPKSSKSKKDETSKKEPRRKFNVVPQSDEYLQYTGLWYNESNSLYFVGSKLAFNTQLGQDKQDKAYHLYQIHTHKNEIVFDIRNLYEAMTVTFVRNEQFTVVPYFFDLIRLWKEV